MRFFSMPILLAPALLALGACAASSGANHYSSDMDRLQSECAARDGILTPTGATSGEPARDYACEIRGGASRIN